MCDACLQLGSPWLPALHGDQPRPRPRAKALPLARHKVKPLRSNRPARRPKRS